MSRELRSTPPADLGWEFCPMFADARDTGIGTMDDPADWEGLKATPDAPCGHLEHLVVRGGDLVLPMGRVPAPPVTDPGAWHCTTDHTTWLGCGTCDSCRSALARGWSVTKPGLREAARQVAIDRLHAESHPRVGAPSGNCRHGPTCGRLAKATAEVDRVLAALPAAPAARACGNESIGHGGVTLTCALPANHGGEFHIDKHGTSWSAAPAPPVTEPGLRERIEAFFSDHVYLSRVPTSGREQRWCGFGKCTWRGDDNRGDHTSHESWNEYHAALLASELAVTEPGPESWPFGPEAAARVVATVAWPNEARDLRDGWAPRMLTDHDVWANTTARARERFASALAALPAPGIAGDEGER